MTGCTNWYAAFKARNYGSIGSGAIGLIAVACGTWSVYSKVLEMERGGFGEDLLEAVGF